MTLHRRTLLKGLAGLPFLPFLDSIRANSWVPSLAQTQSFIILQGLFFLEFDPTNLIVATPLHQPSKASKLHPHVYFKRTHGDSSLLTMPTDVPSTGLKAGTVNCFPPQVIQFSRKVIGHNSSFLRGATDYRCKMILPFPKDILRLRRAPSKNFCPKTNTPNSKVANSLLYGSEIATVLALVYDPDGVPPTTEIYYAEHAYMTDPDEVNGALESAKRLCGNDFDLQVDACLGSSQDVDNQADLPDGISPEDEFGIMELLGYPPNTSSQPKPPLGAVDCGPASTPKKPPKHTNRTQHPPYIFHIGDVSSCPLFGITG